MGINQYLLINKQEFFKYLANYKPPKNVRVKSFSRFKKPNKDTFIKTYRSFSGEARDQGLCGACFAFATTDTISIMRHIYGHDEYVKLSPQDILDQSALGCDGGTL